MHRYCNWGVTHHAQNSAPRKAEHGAVISQLFGEDLHFVQGVALRSRLAGTARAEEVRREMVIRTVLMETIVLREEDASEDCSFLRSQA